MTQESLSRLFSLVQAFYGQQPPLPFHGWHHVAFVFKKTRLFAEDLGADADLAQSAALVHDLNYLAHRKTLTEAKQGADLRAGLLTQAGYTTDVQAQIEAIVLSASIEGRGADLSLEAKALSDADTLFKALPLTPILFASAFINETNYSIEKLCHKVLEDQEPLWNKGIYFYSACAQKLYSKWAETNLNLWQNVKESFGDPDVLDLLQDYRTSAPTKV